MERKKLIGKVGHLLEKGYIRFAFKTIADYLRKNPDNEVEKFKRKLIVDGIAGRLGRTPSERLEYEGVCTTMLLGEYFERGNRFELDDREQDKLKELCLEKMKGGINTLAEVGLSVKGIASSFTSELHALQDEGMIEIPRRRLTEDEFEDLKGHLEEWIGEDELEPYVSDYSAFLFPELDSFEPVDTFYSRRAALEEELQDWKTGFLSNYYNTLKFYSTEERKKAEDLAESLAWMTSQNEESLRWRFGKLAESIIKSVSERNADLWLNLEDLVTYSPEHDSLYDVLEDRDQGYMFRAAALLGLAEAEGEKAIPYLREAIERKTKQTRYDDVSKGRVVKEVCIRALGGFGEEGLKLVKGYLRAHPDHYARAIAAEVLGDIGREEYIPILREALEDRSGLVRFMAGKAILSVFLEREATGGRTRST